MDLPLPIDPWAFQVFSWNAEGVVWSAEFSDLATAFSIADFEAQQPANVQVALTVPGCEECPHGRSVHIGSAEAGWFPFDRDGVYSDLVDDGLDAF